MSAQYKVIKAKYDLKKISAARVWEYADDGAITGEEAARICGPRP